MGRHERTDRERVLDDRQRATGVFAVDLEDDTDTGCQTSASTLAGLDNLQSRPDFRVLDRHRRLLRNSSEQTCILNIDVGDVNIECTHAFNEIETLPDGSSR